MKLHCANYVSLIDTEGVYENVFIEDVSYELRRNEKLFKVKFEMFHIKNDKRIKLDEAEISFRGSNEDQQSGLPTTNKTTILRLLDFVYDPAIPKYILTENFTVIPEHEEIDEEGNTVLIEEEIVYESVLNPAYIPESGIVSMLKYLYTHEGQMPENYEVVEWGWATQEDALKYFAGGSLENPELFLPAEFSKNWLKNNLQMKGNVITNFEFVD